MDKVKEPTLTELKTRECTNAELQAALVALITKYNKQGKDMEKAIHRLEYQVAGGGVYV